MLFTVVNANACQTPGTQLTPWAIASRRTSDAFRLYSLEYR